MSNINACTADFEAGTNGSTISTGDTGSATAWDAVDIGTAAHVIYDATHVHKGTLAAKCSNGATANVGADLEWTVTHLGTVTSTNTCYYRFYVYWPGGNPSTSVTLLKGFNTSSQSFVVAINTAGKVVLQDSGGTTRATSTTTAPSSAGWVRIEVSILQGSVNGAITCRLYYTDADAASASFDESLSASTINLLTQHNAVKFGLVVGPANYSLWFDDIASSPTTWLGPTPSTDQIVPATINATSSMSMSLTDARLLGLAGITGSSNVSASVARIRPMVPASNSATSNISASLVSARLLALTLTNVTSAITASLVRLRSIAPSITATSGMAVSLIRQRFFPAIAATSNISGVITGLPIGNFPVPGVLDNFNRAALDVNWTVPLFGSTGLRITANQLESTSTTFAGNGYYSAKQFGPDVDAYITITAQPQNGSDHPRLFARMTNPGASLSGYRVARSYDAAGNSTVTLTRFDSGTPTVLLVVSENFNVGDKIGIRCYGSVISIYRYDSGAAKWHELGYAIDSTYLTAGYVGVQASSANVGHTQSLLDDFAAATVNVQVSPATINATSSMAAGLVGIRRLIPSISAVSPMTVTMGAVRHIIPSIVSTSNISAFIARGRPIGGLATISGSSPITASVSRIRPLGTFSITASSTVTTIMQKLKTLPVPIDQLVATSDVVITAAVPIGIRATSNMSAHVSKLRVIFTVSISAASNMSASINKLLSIIPGLQAKSDMTAGIARIRRLIPSINSTSNMVSTVNRLRPIFATLNGVSSITARINRFASIVATINATSLMSVASSVLRGILPSSVTATSNVSSGLVRVRNYYVTNNATSNVTGAIGRVRHIAPTITATSVITGSIVRVRRIQGAAINATSSMLAGLAKQGLFFPFISSTSNISASVHALRGIATGGITSTSNVVANTNRLRGIFPSITASSNVSANTVRLRGLLVTFSANSDIDANVHAFKSVAPTISSTSDITGNLHMIRGFAPSITATSDVAGALRKLSIHDIVLIKPGEIIHARSGDTLAGI